MGLISNLPRVTMCLSGEGASTRRHQSGSHLMPGLVNVRPIFTSGHPDISVAVLLGSSDMISKYIILPSKTYTNYVLIYKKQR